MHLVRSSSQYISIILSSLKETSTISRTDIYVTIQLAACSVDFGDTKQLWLQARNNIFISTLFPWKDFLQFVLTLSIRQYRILAVFKYIEVISKVLFCILLSNFLIHYIINQGIYYTDNCGTLLTSVINLGSLLSTKTEYSKYCKTIGAIWDSHNDFSSKGNYYQLWNKEQGLINIQCG